MFLQVTWLTLELRVRHVLTSCKELLRMNVHRESPPRPSHDRLRRRESIPFAKMAESFGQLTSRRSRRGRALVLSIWSDVVEDFWRKTGDREKKVWPVTEVRRWLFGTAAQLDGAQQRRRAARVAAELEERTRSGDFAGLTGPYDRAKWWEEFTQARRASF